MSLPYKVGRLPNEYDPRAIEKQFEKLLDAMNQGYVFVRFYMHSAEPERIVPDMVVYADATNWDPGSGRGLYRRNHINTAWIFIG
jgi:hypothetical protein